MGALLGVYGYRITKYNPEYRDSRGRYLAEELTSISDVGKKFSGIELSWNKYLLVEARYLVAIGRFARDSEVLNMRVCGLEFGSSAMTPECVREGDWISVERSYEVARQILREELWCRLETDGGFRIHFGYDYYMYVESSVSCSVAAVETRRDGLYVEEDFMSPYRISGSDVTNE